MEGLLEKVASYNNEDSALGYSVYYYARNMKDTPGLRFMAVNGVTPDSDTIRDESSGRMRPPIPRSGSCMTG